MKERPILFSAPMVRALLDGSKAQTRRIVKPQPDQAIEGEPYWHIGGYRLRETATNPLLCPYGKPGDRLFVRETWAHVGTMDPGLTVYRADYPMCVPPGYQNVPPVDAITWKPSIHMFRKDSRITLEIESVRVERLQDISEADAYAEGIEQTAFCEEAEHLQPATGVLPGRYAYRALWESINGAGSWDASPWVWGIEFKRIKP